MNKIHLPYSSKIKDENKSGNHKLDDGCQKRVVVEHIVVFRRVNISKKYQKLSRLFIYSSIEQSIWSFVMSNKYLQPNLLRAVKNVQKIMLSVAESIRMGCDSFYQRIKIICVTYCSFFSFFSPAKLNNCHITYMLLHSTPICLSLS